MQTSWPRRAKAGPRVAVLVPIPPRPGMGGNSGVSSTIRTSYGWSTRRRLFIRRILAGKQAGVASALPWRDWMRPTITAVVVTNRPTLLARYALPGLVAVRRAGMEAVILDQRAS